MSTAETEYNFECGNSHISFTFPEQTVAVCGFRMTFDLVLTKQEKCMSSSNGANVSPIFQKPKSKYNLIPFCTSQSLPKMKFLFIDGDTKNSRFISLLPTLKVNVTHLLNFK